MIGEDAVAFLLFLLLRLASGDLDLWSDDLNWLIRAVVDRIRDDRLVAPLANISDRGLNLFPVPFGPLGSIELGLLLELLIDG